jgi:hypothetical protein
VRLCDSAGQIRTAQAGVITLEHCTLYIKWKFDSLK